MQLVCRCGPLPFGTAQLEHCGDVDGSGSAASSSTTGTRALKCPEIPALSTYRFPPPPNFWNRFPSQPLPTTPSTPINIQRLSSIVDSAHHKMTSGEQARAELLIHELTHGVSVPFSTSLHALREKNSASVIHYGHEFTDILASWVKGGYVAGPFVVPPLNEFRSNSMLAVAQPGKVRAILNMSAPEGSSFNDAVITDALEQVHMATARQFGYSIVDCGPACLIWKWDMIDTYKHLPANHIDLRCQGFCWLGRFFVETQQVFGSSPAVSAFDRLNHTLTVLASISAGFRINRIPAMSPPGPADVWPASGARSTATHAWPPSPSHNGVFLIYMLIWWAHCSTVKAFQKRPQRHAQKL
jgi:hypothetical protein